MKLIPETEEEVLQEEVRLSLVRRRLCCRVLKS